jgi:hypothetical protein
LSLVLDLQNIKKLRLDGLRWLEGERQMGDWDRMFGCDVSAESVIASINSSWKSEHQERLGSPVDAVEGAESLPLTIALCSYEDLVRFDEENPGLVFTRRRNGSGFVMEITAAPPGWRRKGPGLRLARFP